jgi:hypothetical protein
VLRGAHLAPARDAAALLRSPGERWGGAWLPVGVYGGSALVVALAAFERRRRAVDPAQARRRRLLEAERARIRAAAALPAREAAAELARALRRMQAELPHAGSAELDAFLGECDARSYAPPGPAPAAPDADFARRGEALAAEIEARA